MSRLLIVAWYFPPAAGGGVQRVLKAAKYLPQFGVEVDVLTPDDPMWVDAGGQLEVPAGTTVHRVPYRGLPPLRPSEVLAGRHGLDRALTRARLQPRRVMVPDLHVTWARPAARAGARIVRTRGIDVLLSTSPPETDHLVGRRVQRATGVPWIADLRDSWLEEPGLRLDKALVRAKRAINARIAARTIAHADRIVTVSEPIASEQRRRYPQLADADAVRVVMNAVDLEDLVGIEPAPRSEADAERFVLTYTGNFFGQRSPTPLLDATRALLQRRPDLRARLRLRFIGTLKPADAERCATDELLLDVVEVTPFRPYRETLAEQRGADALYLAIADDPRTQGEVTGKVFEYVAARRPILAVVPPGGAAARLLGDAEADMGATVVAPDDGAGIAAALESMVDGGRAPDLPMTAAIEARISRRARAGDLAAIIGELVPG